MPDARHVRRARAEVGEALRAGPACVPAKRALRRAYKLLGRGRVGEAGLHLDQANGLVNDSRVRAHLTAAIDELRKAVS